MYSGLFYCIYKIKLIHGLIKKIFTISYKENILILINQRFSRHNW